MSITIISIIIAIVLLMLGIAFSTKVLSGLKYIARVMNLGMFFNLEGQTSLDKIFYLFNHNNIKSWQHWISKQKESSQNEALSLLLEHLEGDPSNWGLMSPEAVRSIAVFTDGKDDHRSTTQLMNKLLTISSNCKRFWQKYISVDKVHLACWETIIKLDTNQAIELIEKELSSLNSSGNAFFLNIVNAINEIDPDTDIAKLLSEILTYSKLEYKVKKQCLDIMKEKRHEEENHKTIRLTLSNLIKYQTPMENDDLTKILVNFLNLYPEDVEEDIVKSLIKLSVDKVYSTASINAIQNIVTRDPNLFSPETLYCFVSSSKPNINDLVRALAKIFALSTGEIEICLNKEPLPDFKPQLMETEEIEKFDVIEALAEQYKAINKSVITATSIELTLVTGNSEVDKLYLARSVAANNGLKFLYANYNDLISSELVLRDFIEKLIQLRPILVYISEIDQLLVDKNNSFINKLKKLALDPNIKFITTVNIDQNQFEIPQELTSMLHRGSIHLPELMRMEKSKIFKQKLEIVQQKNKSGLDTSKVLDSFQESSRVEFDQSLRNYFRSGLVSCGKLLEPSEYNQFKAKAKAIQGDINA